MVSFFVNPIQHSGYPGSSWPATVSYFVNPLQHSGYPSSDWPAAVSYFVNPVQHCGYPSSGWHAVVSYLGATSRPSFQKAGFLFHHPTCNFLKEESDIICYEAGS